MFTLLTEPFIRYMSTQRSLQVRAVRKIPAECKDAFAAAVAALRKLGKTDVAIEAVMKVMCVRVSHISVCLILWAERGREASV